MAPTPRPSLAAWWAGARPRTLPAAVVPVAVGAAVAWGYVRHRSGGFWVEAGEPLPAQLNDVTWWRVVAALAVSLLLQIGVNYANDYSDGVRGTDTVRVGPMRLVASGTATPAAVKRAALLAFGLAAVIGLGIAATTSWWLLAAGAAAILAAWGYTGGPKPYGYLGLGELFVFAFFGLMATVGTTYVATKHVPTVAWPAACGVGFLACALLVVNNLRDIPTDTTSGKRTLAVRLGDARTRWFYVVLLVAAGGCATICAAWRPWSLLSLLAAVVAIPPVKAVLGGAKGPALIPVLGGTGKVQLAYGALLSLGLLLA